MTGMIYHMCRAEEWAAAEASGSYAGSSQDRADGFIHFSTAAQIVESARRHRAGQDGLLLLAVEPAALGDRLRWEKSRGGDLFPHVYGTIDPAESAWVKPLPLGADGAHVFPALD
ncbi:MAG TPA: DUF952 domain-containing protein [Stellaceae bacterium]|nr:DUF952 domain-containing protein [Stellaceae bacterium]